MPSFSIRNLFNSLEAKPAGSGSPRNGNGSGEDLSLSDIKGTSSKRVKAKSNSKNPDHNLALTPNYYNLEELD